MALLILGIVLGAIFGGALLYKYYKHYKNKKEYAVEIRYQYWRKQLCFLYFLSIRYQFGNNNYQFGKMFRNFPRV